MASVASRYVASIVPERRSAGTAARDAVVLRPAATVMLVRDAEEPDDATTVRSKC